MTDTTETGVGLPDTLFYNTGFFEASGRGDAEPLDAPPAKPANGYSGPAPRQPADDSEEMHTVVLEERRYNFRQLPDHVLWHPDLVPGEVLFYAKLMYFAAGRGYCTYSVPFMAAACKVSDRSIQNYESHLEELGLLKRKFRKSESNDKKNENNVLKVVQEPEEEPAHAFRHKDVVASVKAELVRRREEKAEKEREKKTQGASGAKPRKGRSSKPTKLAAGLRARSRPTSTAGLLLCLRRTVGMGAYAGPTADEVVPRWPHC
ncbi:helix-turn-helix domain-containing protein [Glycomyces sp. YM15]|uniref:helix-turn-helix domain-containing protein n=1 Tax=Glycomyces sp. YM15 TaxID=2800446 RepID=UPI00196423D6|nr:helix-turn-helix domain-containing protein [Glycomyces sp. YM15]